MVELHHIYVVLYACVAVLASVVSLIAWRHRVARGAVSLAVLMLGVAIWSGAAAAMWYVPTLGQQVFWVTAENLGLWMVPVGFLRVAFDIAGMERWRAPGRMALISIASFALVNIEWLNPGRLFDKAFVARTMGPYTHFASIPGPLYWAYAAFAYALVFVTCVIIFRVYLRSAGAERTQAVILLIGGLVPFVASLVTSSGAVPLDIDLAPLAFLATGPVWLTAILRGTLLDVLPLARDVLVEQMLDGVVVVDADDHVVDANPTALMMLHAPLAEVLGKTAEANFSSVKGATAVLRGSGPRHAVLPFGSDDDFRYVDLGITPLVVGPGRPPAQLVTLHDVTEERRANERLKLARQVFDTANEAIVVTLPDADERIIDVNDAYCRLTGRSREDTVGKDISRLQSDRHSPEFYKAMEQTLFTTGAWEGEVWQTRADGTVFPSWLSLSMAEDDQEHERHVVRVFTDITERRRAEDALRDALEQMRALSAATELERQRLELILEHTDDGVILVGLGGNITFTNPTLRRLLKAMGEQDTPASLAELRELYEIRYADDHPLPPDESPVTQVLTGEVVTDLELHFSRRATGKQLTILFSALPVRDAQGAVMQVVITIRDITERKRSEELLQNTLDALERSHQELLELASHDSLTGLLNRRRFEEEFERQLADQRRLGRGGALIWLDLDHFKDVNDTLGHRAGDELLTLIAQTLRTEMRRYSVLARLGGDEFAMILPAAQKAEAMGAAARLINVLAGREFVVAGHAVHAAVSIGVVLYPDHGSTVQELLAAADVAMYHAKESGRGRVSLYDPEQVWAGEAASRILWGERIRAALAEDRLVLYAQPLQSLTSESSAQYELLVRMIGDDGELIAPLEFIPAAERLGLIGELDRWVVRQAIRLLAAEEAAGEPTCLSINLSGRTLSDAGILDVFREEFAATGADPRRLTAEVTETAVVSNIAEATSLVRELHRLGCRFSMDDFGTGASSFYYLRRLPVDVLKIDGSLIKGLGVEPADKQFVRAIVQMCEALHISSVAESVENGAVLTEARDAGVDYAQGFSVGRPEPLGVYLRSQASSG